MNKTNKILIGIIVILLAVILFLIIKQNPGIKINEIAKTKVFENKVSPGTNIIQARLVGVNNPSYVSIAKKYEGHLTFQNLMDGEQHEYFVCLEDWSTVKINEVYDLPANYYIPSGSPTGSMMTNGCNGPLHLSNIIK